MPTWGVWLLGFSALLIAASTVWKLFLGPLMSAVKLAIEVFPLMATFVKEFKDSPNSLKVINEIAAQFKTDSGSSLRDVVNGLTEAVAAIKDRDHVVATNLSMATTKIEGIAADLDAARTRADAIDTDVHEAGTAADVAAQHEPELPT